MTKVSIKMLAKKINLSPATVSAVLNGRGDELRISKETQNRIWKEAKELGYRPNIYARRLRQQSKGNSATVIGILWPSVYSSELLVRFFDSIQNSILNEEINVEIIYKPYRLSEIYKLEDVFKEHLFNGVIIVGATDKDIEYVSTVECSMPIVFFNRQNDKFGSVCIDNYKAGEKVAQLLSARGHKSVGFVEPGLYSYNFSMRKIGFLDGCQKRGIAISPEHLIVETPDEQGGRRSMEKLLQSASLPTVLFFLASSFLPGAYPILHKNGIRIPEDIEIICYSDMLSCKLMNPSVTVIDLPIEKMVKKCLFLILDMINGQIQDSVNIFEETYFIFRESCPGFPNGEQDWQQ